jgi:hypothetical protein
MVEHELIDLGLIERFGANDLGRDFIHHIPDGFQDSLTQVPAGVPIAKLERFVLARRCPRRHGSSAGRTTHQFHVDLDGGIPSGVQNLARAYGDDLGHDFTSRST